MIQMRQLERRSRINASMKRLGAQRGALDSLMNQGAKKPAVHFGKEMLLYPGYLAFVAEAVPMTGGAQRRS